VNVEALGATVLVLVALLGAAGARTRGGVVVWLGVAVVIVALFLLLP
jgi:hypothetical protein